MGARTVSFVCLLDCSIGLSFISFIFEKHVSLMFFCFHRSCHADVLSCAVIRLLEHIIRRAKRTPLDVYTDLRSR
jgi:hypothetical protein